MYIKPCFYDDFFCKAEKCADTCCAGWEVDIDEETLKKYNEVQGRMGDRLKESIICTDGQPCFLLDHKDRCCFLSENGLCDIYSLLGNDYLCDICKEHPRFYDDFDGITQCGLGLCCEQVCNLLVESDVLEFEKNFEYDDIPEDTAILLETRDVCFGIINDRTKSFELRVKELLDYAADVETELFGVTSDTHKFVDTKNAIADILCLYGKTEPVNALWVGFLYHLNNNFHAISACDYMPDLCLYEKLLSYIIYRHFMNCRFDGKIYNVIRFAVCALIFIYTSECLAYIMKGDVTVTDKIDAIKRWSRQIEYSQENTDICLTFDIS